MTDTDPALKAAWVGADGGAFLFGVSEFTETSTVLTDLIGSDPALIGAFGFAAAGAVGLAHKVGVIGE
jgi:hypothetical protein